MSIKLPVITAAFVAIASTGALAHDFDSMFKERQSHQVQRIEQGRRSGEITWLEGIRLRSELRRIDAAERKFLADDGRIDGQEFRQLRAMQDEASGHIQTEAHDGWSRPSWIPRIGK